MKKIHVVFARRDAALAFANMAEGMWENHRDDAVMGDKESENRLALWNEFTDVINTALVPKNAHGMVIDEKFRPLVEDVRDNCADNAHDMGIDETSDLEEKPGDAAMACGDWEVTISDYAEPDYTLASAMGTREALEEALSVLEMRASETDTASPEGHRARLAIESIKAMLVQRGCEHFEGDGTLTDLCDIIIYG